jgi:CMD domain protein
MAQNEPDVIDQWIGAEAASLLTETRAARSATRDNAQKSYLALFSPDYPGTVSLDERRAIAVFVAGLHREPGAAAFYRNGFARSENAAVVEAIEAEAAKGAVQGPYGRYPEGPLSAEDKAGPVHRLSDEHRRILGARLSAGLEHAHLLVFRPRDASPEALKSLLDAGWSTDDIVTLSQLVAFLSFQIRVVVGLRVLAASLAKSA